MSQNYKKDGVSQGAPIKCATKASAGSRGLCAKKREKKKRKKESRKAAVLRHQALVIVGWLD
ncbi:hypothetical protein AN958_02636 [Leucoagaricus sp. SymC.cos]|nr:hypothetical protein AN958_02636 [Leucoagaricus sp. SymC.cos]